MAIVGAGDPLRLSGQILHDQFRVGELAEDSSRAYLYKGTHVGSEVPVALKFLKLPPGANSDALLKRFRHESRIHYALSQSSAHVVRLFASGSTIPPESDVLTPFNVLEWLRGKTLATDFAERRAHWGKGRTVEETIALLDPAVEALAVAHSQQVIHREVTPANLFLATAHERPTMKVLDFGFAKLVGGAFGDEGNRAQTVDLGPLVSPIYAAPEQFSRDAGEVGPSTDLYSLMMIFMEALRDKPVMDDSGSPLAVRVLDPKNRPTPRSLDIKIGPNLELVIGEAIAVKPADRPQNLAEFWANLKRAALKDARSVSISSPPSLHPRGVDAGLDDDETEVEINMSFARASRAVTIPRPEPETMSRPFDEAEPVSSLGEMFTMAPAPHDPVATPRVQLPPRAKTLVSPGQIHPDDIPTEAKINRDPEWKATLLSTPPRFSQADTPANPVRMSSAPTPTVNLPASSASSLPFRRDSTAVMPFVTTPPAEPQLARPSQASSPLRVSEPRVSQPVSVQRAPSPWLTMLIVFVVCAAILTVVAVMILR